MNTLQNIYNKLSEKTELEKHNVNLLSAIEELKKMEQYIKKEHALLVKNSAKYVQMKEETGVFYKKEVAAIGYNLRLFIKNEAWNARDKYLAKLKELGIEEKDNDALIEFRNLQLKINEDLDERYTSNFWWIGTIK